LRATTTGGTESPPSGAASAAVGVVTTNEGKCRPQFAVRSYIWLEFEAFSFNVGSYSVSPGHRNVLMASMARCIAVSAQSPAKIHASKANHCGSAAISRKNTMVSVPSTRPVE